MADGGDDGDDECGVGCQLGGEQDKGEYLLSGRRLGVGIDFLVGSLLALARGHVCLLGLAAEHGDVVGGIATSSILQMNGEKEKDSVVNFLTPTKLITSGLKPKQRLHPNDSLFSHSSKHRQDDPNRNYNSQFDRLNYGFNRSQEEVEPLRADLHDSRDVYSTSHYNQHHALDNPSKTALRSEDNFRGIVPDRTDTRSEHPPQTSFVLYKVENTNEPAEPFVKLIDASGVEEGLKTSGLRDQRDNQYPIESERRDFVGYTEGLSSLIMQLKSVKVMIEGSLGELQFVLDNTSKFMQNMEEEYGRIKQRVLDFTAQALDAGFTRYRQSMVNWSKYEQVQVKTKLMLQQMEKTIREDEVVVEEMNKLAKNSRIIFSKQTELNQKITLFSNLIPEINTAKAECLSMRPHLTKDRVLAFEEAVSALAGF